MTTQSSGNILYTIILFVSVSCLEEGDMGFPSFELG